MNLWKRLRNRVLSLEKDSAPRLLIANTVYCFIVETTKESPVHETGGILIGYDKEFEVEVTHATLPGPKAYHSPSMFTRDTEYCMAELKKTYELTGADYVGEWHSHIMPLRGISSGDLITVASIIYDQDYKFNTFASIVAIFDNNKVGLVGYVAKGHFIYSVNVEVKEG